MRKYIVYSLVRITGVISKVNGVYVGDWDIICEGNIDKPIKGPNEVFSLFLNKKTRNDLLQNHIHEFNVLETKLSDTGKCMIVLKSEAFQNNILFIGIKTFHVLACNLCSNVDPVKSSIEEKLKQLNFVLRSKKVITELKTEKEVTSMDDILNLTINVVIKD